MRTVTYGAACSLDGYIAGRDGGIDWIRFGPDVGKLMESYWKTVDTILIGRKTFDDAIRRGGGGSFPDVTTYLFSRTLASSPDPSVHLVTDNAGPFVRELKNTEGKGICLMSGGDLASSLFAAGVVDEVSVNVQPVLLGSGVSLFRDPGREIRLQLLETATLDDQCVLVNYRVRYGR